MCYQTDGKRRMLNCFPSKKRVKNFAQQKPPNGSEMRKGRGTGAAGHGQGKALTPISSATRRVITHMLCSYSRLNWPLADSNGMFCVRATSVIPCSIRVASVKMHTILFAVTVTWFAIVPLLIISIRRAAIKPIKFVISFPVQHNPSIARVASIPQQVGNKFVFIL